MASFALFALSPLSAHREKMGNSFHEASCRGRDGLHKKATHWRAAKCPELGGTLHQSQKNRTKRLIMYVRNLSGLSMIEFHLG